MDEEYDEFQKLDESMHLDHLSQVHTELKQINEKELEALSRVIKDKNGNIIDDLHKTFPILTKYERARVLGLRTKQINNGSQIFVKNENNIIDGYNLALLELQQKKIPYIIQRPIPNGASEYWKLQDLELIDF